MIGESERDESGRTVVSDTVRSLPTSPVKPMPVTRHPLNGVA
jgi:hypothetical protein